MSAGERATSVGPAGRAFRGFPTHRDTIVDTGVPQPRVAHTKSGGLCATQDPAGAAAADQARCWPTEQNPGQDDSSDSYRSRLRHQLPGGCANARFTRLQARFHRRALARSCQLRSAAINALAVIHAEAGSSCHNADTSRATQGDASSLDFLGSDMAETRHVSRRAAPARFLHHRCVNQQVHDIKLEGSAANRNSFFSELPDELERCRATMMRCQRIIVEQRRSRVLNYQIVRTSMTVGIDRIRIGRSCPAFL